MVTKKTLHAPLKLTNPYKEKQRVKSCGFECSCYVHSVAVTLLVVIHKLVCSYYHQVSELYIIYALRSFFFDNFSKLTRQLQPSNTARIANLQTASQAIYQPDQPLESG